MNNKHFIPVIDCEASGLSEESYPIQVAIILADGTTKQWFIKPEKEWTFWDPNAEKIHGFTREHIARVGQPAHIVAKEINAFAGGQYLYSDAVRYEQFWLERLFRAANVAPAFALSCANAYCDQVAWEHRRVTGLNPLEQGMHYKDVPEYEDEYFRRTGLRQHDALADVKAIQWATAQFCNQFDNN